MRRATLLVSLSVLLACSSSSKPQCQSGCPTVQSCATTLDCTDPADVCVDGGCVPGSDGGASSTDAGAADAGRVDAGSPGLDGGPADAGIDAGSVDAGLDGGAVDGGEGSDAGPAPDAGTEDAGCSSDADCTPPLICCAGGGCTPGSCVFPGCQQDSQCNPPAEVCDEGACVAGCFYGSCDAGLRCDGVATGRCLPASGSGAPGAACQSFSDCGATPANSNGGDCVSVPLADGGKTFCSFVCQGTSQCPPAFACVNLGGGGQCTPEALAGSTLGSGAIGTFCSSVAACASTAGCGDYATSGGTVCTDSCQGPSSHVCPTGWECNDAIHYASLLDGGSDGGVSCKSDSDCTKLSPDALCYTSAQGGTNRCYLVFQADDCYEIPSIIPPGTTGVACTTDSDCTNNLCNAGVCAGACCAASDCPKGYACAPVLEQQFSVLMACVTSAGTGAVGAPCDPTAATNACRATWPSPGGGVAGAGLCLPVDPYSASDTTGYCSDYCCDDTECGAGYTCGPTEIGTDAKGNPLYANACLLL